MKQDKLKVTETTAFHDGTCSFCNDNIGPHGTIDLKQKIYIIKGRYAQVRFCRECLLEIFKEVKPLLKVQKIDNKSFADMTFDEMCDLEAKYSLTAGRPPFRTEPRKSKTKHKIRSAKSKIKPKPEADDFISGWTKVIKNL